MALTKNIQPIYEIGEVNEAPLTASAKVFLGAALGYTGNNTVRPLVAGDKFAGFAIDAYDQTLGVVNARFKEEGYIRLAVTGVAVNTAIGTAVYASDDGTFTLTASTNSYIGSVYRVEASGIAVVEFDADGRKLAGGIAALTDTGGGVVAAGIVDAGAVYSQATANANFATLAAKINAIAAALS